MILSLHHSSHLFQHNSACKEASAQLVRLRLVFRFIFSFVIAQLGLGGNTFDFTVYRIWEHGEDTTSVRGRLLISISKIHHDTLVSFTLVSFSFAGGVL